MSGQTCPPVCATVRRPVRAAAATAPPLDCPREPLGCQATFWPPSARQRARTDAVPCLPNTLPRRLTKKGTGTAVRCPCRSFLTPHTPLSEALRIADRSWRSAAVPHLPRVLCGLSALLTSVWNVMPPGSCVKARPVGGPLTPRQVVLVAGGGAGRWPLARSPPAGLPPPAYTGLRPACQEDGHRGVAATEGNRWGSWACAGMWRIP